MDQEFTRSTHTAKSETAVIIVSSVPLKITSAFCEAKHNGITNILAQLTLYSQAQQ